MGPAGAAGQGDGHRLPVREKFWNSNDSVVTAASDSEESHAHSSLMSDPSGLPRSPALSKQLRALQF